MTGEPGGLQSTGSQRVGHNSVTEQEQTGLLQTAELCELSQISRIWDNKCIDLKTDSNFFCLYLFPSKWESQEIGVEEK